MLCSLSHGATWPGAGWKDVPLPHKVWCSVLLPKEGLPCCFFFLFSSRKFTQDRLQQANQEQMLSCGYSCNEWLPVFSCCPEPWCPLRGEDAARTPQPAQLVLTLHKPTPLRCFKPMSLKSAFFNKHGNTHSVFGSTHFPDFPGDSQMHKWVGTSVEPAGGQGSKASFYPLSASQMWKSWWKTRLGKGFINKSCLC